MRKVRNLAPDHIARARELRSNMSLEERKLWHLLRHKRIGWKFRRQHPVLDYYLDFYCPELKLCIELDGEQHSETMDRDRVRDARIAECGIETWRISTSALRTPDALAESIWAYCYRKAHGVEPERWL